MVPGMLLGTLLVTFPGRVMSGSPGISMVSCRPVLVSGVFVTTGA